MRGIEKEEWRGAICEEIKNIDKKDTWKLVPRPEGCKVVKKKCVFTKKKDESNSHTLSCKASSKRLWAKEWNRL